MDGKTLVKGRVGCLQVKEQLADLLVVQLIACLHARKIREPGTCPYAEYTCIFVHKMQPESEMEFESSRVREFERENEH